MELLYWNFELSIYSRKQKTFLRKYFFVHFKQPCNVDKMHVYVKTLYLHFSDAE